MRLLLLLLLLWWRYLLRPSWLVAGLAVVGWGAGVHALVRVRSSAE